MAGFLKNFQNKADDILFGGRKAGQFGSPTEDIGATLLNATGLGVQALTGRSTSDLLGVGGTTRFARENIDPITDTSAQALGIAAPIAANLVAPGSGAIISGVQSGLQPMVSGIDAQNQSYLQDPQISGAVSGVGNAVGMAGQMGVFANGGRYLKRYADGGMANAEFVELNGQTHDEVAPNGQTGIEMGAVEVEGGETKIETPIEDYIFSDRLLLEDSKMTFAEKSKKIKSKYKNADKDSIEKRTMMRELNALREEQEELKESAISEGGEVEVKEDNATSQPTNNIENIPTPNQDQMVAVDETSIQNDTELPEMEDDAAEGLQMASGGAVSKDKAKKIMSDGAAQGKPLTNKQKGYFGFIAGGGKPKMTNGGVGNAVPEINRFNNVGTGLVSPTLSQSSVSPFATQQSIVAPELRIGADRTTAMGTPIPELNRFSATPNPTLSSGLDNGLGSPDDLNNRPLGLSNLQMLPGALGQLAAPIHQLGTTASPVDYQRVTPSEIDLQRERDILVQRGTAAQNIAQRNIRSAAPSVGSYLSNIGSTVARVNEATGQAISRSLMEEERASAMAESRANEINAQIQRQEAIDRQREADAVRQAQNNALKDIGAITAQAGQDINKNEAQNIILDNLESGNIEYGFKSDGSRGFVFTGTNIDASPLIANEMTKRAKDKETSRRSFFNRNSGK